MQLHPQWVLLALAPWLACHAQEPVPVQHGSYAAFPPPGAAVDGRTHVDKVAEVEQRPLYLVKDDGRPIPSNKWYQNLIFQKFGTGLWAYPHKVDATEHGLELFFPTSWKSDGAAMKAEFPLIIGGQDFKPADSRAKQWTDWTVSFRVGESADRYFDATLGEGMPYLWVEYHGVKPHLSWGGKSGKGGKGAAPSAATPSFFDAAGHALALPAAVDTLGITYEGRSYGVFAPDGCRFSSGDDGLDVTFAGKESYLVFCPLPKAEDIAVFQKYAYAIPRDTKFSWTYDATAGTLATHWKIVTEPLKGTEHRVLQGWLPHHWRSTKNDLAFASIDYATPRGQMRCAVGDEFTITYPYNGILPNLPQPQELAAENHRYQASRMKEYLSTYFGGKLSFAVDTYAGGKDMVRALQAAFIAKQLGDPLADGILAQAREELTNWLTYTPGESRRYFAYYPHRKGLIGFPSSFGSEHFTDNHFHYGYFTFAAGMLGMLDPGFVTGYGEMAKLVAKEYANWDRQDQRFPYFRAFDCWRGHSFADGNGFPDGNNQESTSEAVQSWAGMILLGRATGDAELTAAGVMGYSLETRATQEYWFNVHGDVFPTEYHHPIAGMIWCNGNVWGTWFTASPSWIYGIQWIPTSPAAAYLAPDASAVQKTYATMLQECQTQEQKEAAKKSRPVKPIDLRSLGGELASYHLGYVMMGDPAWAAEQLDTLWAEPEDKVAHNIWMADVYYQTHAWREFGHMDGEVHADCATATAFTKTPGGARTFVAWNPSGREEVVTYYSGGKTLGSMRVAAHSMASTGRLTP